MKLIIPKIPANPAKIIIVSSFLLLNILSCKSVDNINTERLRAYKIINKEGYGDKVLYYKTLSYETLPNNIKFNYNYINQNNFYKNWILEQERYIDLDTIFSNSQQTELNQKFEDLKSVKLKFNRLKNPNSLSKNISDKFYKTEDLKGFIRLSYPIFQKGSDGKLYVFIYRSYYNQGILFIYKNVESKWVEFAKVPIWIS